MRTQIGGGSCYSLPTCFSLLRGSQRNIHQTLVFLRSDRDFTSEKPLPGKYSIQCSEKQSQNVLRTCKNCKTQFDPLLNHPRACRFHTAHFGGETKRKFESVYTGGTMDTPDSGMVFQYWHCCGSEDPFDPGCTAAPHASYDD
ncbi:unnamed protein product [Coffea canephora]|uniref:Uncharacterized protein n=1 Tax=Coffea canephora TaxID=49390 RepID=A0A068U3K6_COFCA|nr:uncharacterized protein LOC113698425 [Coffea arabica]CDP02724.1 unnamed protein product [Coffea canephora]